MAFINSILSLFTQKRLTQIDYFKANPGKVQRDTLQDLLNQAANTEYGQKYNFSTSCQDGAEIVCLPVFCIRSLIKQVL